MMKLFSAAVNGRSDASVLTTTALYDESNRANNYGLVDIHELLTIQIPVDPDKSMRIHIIFTAPDTWNDAEAWTWFAIHLNTGLPDDDGAVVARGLYGTAKSLQRIPITLQAVCDIEAGEAGSMITIKPQWATQSNCIAAIGALSPTVLTAQVFESSDPIGL